MFRCQTCDLDIPACANFVHGNSIRVPLARSTQPKVTLILYSYYPRIASIECVGLTNPEPRVKFLPKPRSSVFESIALKLQ